MGTSSVGTGGGLVWFQKTLSGEGGVGPFLISAWRACRGCIGLFIWNLVLGLGWWPSSIHTVMSGEEGGWGGHP